MPNPHESWVFGQLPHIFISGPGATFGWPSQSRLRRASVSAAASGAVCQWQTSSTDRRGSGDRPLGNVPPGRSGPKGGAKSRLPLWGRCHAFGMTERATCPRRARALAVRTGAAFSRQSRLPARSVLNGPHWGPGPLGAKCPGCNPRELRAQALGRSGKTLRCFPSFLSCAARHKGKTVGRWSHLPVRSAQGVCHRQTAPHTLQAF